jgi:flavin-dependent dehydrogenase
MNVDSTRTDVVIIGGGLAGLTLALQLERARPETRVVVVDKLAHPVPEAAFKVGESTSEVGGYYLREFLSLGDHLAHEQLVKPGMRFFLSGAGNTDLTRRVEVGTSTIPRVHGYQLDRGRFENELLRQATMHGVECLNGCKVTHARLDPRGHVLTVRQGERTSEIEARWVVDASGFAGMLRRQLDLANAVSHDASAAWFRIAEVIDPHEWSDDPVWQARVRPGIRRLSTNHLMGRGYWVWLIPLASGSTSIGIVADPSFHPFEHFNRFDRALRWLAEYEPQCARSVEAHRGRLQDFHVLRHYAHGCARVYSTNRWALTGVAGVFLDPLYSPGTDFIGISNTFIVDLITRDLADEPISERLEQFNSLYLSLFDAFMVTFERQYAVMGNPQVWTAKVAWDFANYWGGVGLLFCHDKLRDLDFMRNVAGYQLSRLNRLNHRMQALFRDWDEIDSNSYDAAYRNVLSLDALSQLQSGLATRSDDAALGERLADNVRLCQSMAIEIFQVAARELSVPLKDGKLNPYKIGLRPERWEADRLFSGTAGSDRAVARELAKLWLPVQRDAGAADGSARPATQAVGAPSSGGGR